MFNRGIILIAIVTAVAVCSAFGQSSVVQGNVRGTNGKPLPGTEIRAEGKSGKFSTTTDSRGNYNYKRLPAGVYQICVVADGEIKKSTTVRTGAGNSRLDFDLKPAAKKVKHYVWVQPQTGSHLGGGWVEADDSGNAVDGNSNIRRDDGSLVRAMSRNTTNMRDGTMPMGR